MMQPPPPDFWTLDSASKIAGIIEAIAVTMGAIVAVATVNAWRTL